MSSDFDFSVCRLVHQRDEAKVHLEKIRKNIDLVAKIQPAVAAISEKEFQDLLQKYREEKICPVITDEKTKYRDELFYLIGKTADDVSAASEAAQQEQQLRLEDKRSSTRVMILGSIATIVVTGAVIATVVILMRAQNVERRS